ncbi:tetratricopeptide repeat protein [Foetidibacter luteolus]|uniref:tetratricopeptide repeat protein n=1 Tax=Foetidibacter luteolus TaxID=2608880 RepID=UPI00129AAAD4|nr:tetratricopeptide repeat protein [Foetidibacter luteolus]
MKRFFLTVFIGMLPLSLYAQSPVIDSLNRLLAKAKTDTSRINLLAEKVSALNEINLDSAISLGSRIIAEAQVINYRKGEAALKRLLVASYCFKGDYSKARQYLQETQQVYTSLKDTVGLIKTYSSYGMFYGMQTIYDSSVIFYQQSIKLAELIKDEKLANRGYQNIAIPYQMQSKHAQAMSYFQKALAYFEKKKDDNSLAYLWLNIGITYMAIFDTARAENSLLKAIDFSRKAGIQNVELYACSNLSNLYAKKDSLEKSYDYAMRSVALSESMGDLGMKAAGLSKAASARLSQKKMEEAEMLVRNAIRVADSAAQPLNIFQANIIMGRLHLTRQQYAAAIPYYEKAFAAIENTQEGEETTGVAYSELSLCYEETGNYKAALSYHKLATNIMDSLRNKENVRRATELGMSYEFEKKQQLQDAEKKRHDAVTAARQSALSIGLVLAFLLALLAFYAYKNKQKANLLLEKQKQEIENTLNELRITQRQLVQAEKMASLGELTAGIAHEIQNPLNFINNFAEVNEELADEVLVALKAGDTGEALDITADIKQNSQKIAHHGKRADGIVKGMLQHSRTGTGQKELTDINKLVDEYTRLSYHGMRAKDKNFQVKLLTEFEDGIPAISIVPQDIGRVLLNLLGNAFYAVAEKKRLSSAEFEPTVVVTTKKITHSNGTPMIEIAVKDNGNGVPAHVAEKIFQPFFTTKPTGQGTGLGLSLSYDIVKLHNGFIDLQTKEGEGAIFVLQLPV